MTERDRLHLTYILESIQLIRGYVAEGQSVFLKQPLVQDAVLRRLETLCDAAAKLPRELQERHPEIPWRRIQDFRNIAAHAYTEINLRLVWSILEDDLPPLEKVVEQELRAQ